MSERKGDWIQCASGTAFWPLDPRPEEILIEDIAHSLSLKTRFNGHCLDFYSVAEHSLYCSIELIAVSGDKKLALWGLLHDAAEAMLADVPKPIKPFLVGFSDIEDGILKCVAEKYGLSWPMPPEVKKMDGVLLSTETRDIMGNDAHERWGKAAGVALPHIIKPMPWQKAKTAFLLMFEFLTFQTSLS